MTTAPALDSAVLAPAMMSPVLLALTTCGNGNHQASAPRFQELSHFLLGSVELNKLGQRPGCLETGSDFIGPMAVDEV